MARKNTLVYTQPTHSLTASFISPVTVVEHLDNCSYQINCVTTDSSGTFAIQASNDYDPGGPISGTANPGNWITLDVSGVPGTSPFVSGADTNILVDLNQLPFVATRVVYTATVPGTGVCTIIVSDKQSGG